MNDFPDKLSPILVKELRQGLRAHVFVALFLLLQVALILPLLFSTSTSSSSTATGFFWFFIGATFLFCLPLRGVTTIASEIKGKTVELLSLTQLSAWRIVFGKWVALAVQSALILCSILPYIMVRYFVGGIDLVEELKRVLFFFGLSLLLTAVAVGISALMTKSLYIVGGVLAAILMPMGLTQVLSFFFFSHRGGSAAPAFYSTALWCMAPWIMLAVLEISASAIAPAGENRTSYRRLYALGILATSLVLGTFFHQPSFFLGLTYLLLLPFVVFEITTRPPAIPSLYLAPRPLRFPRIPPLNALTRWLSEPDSVRGATFSLLLLAAPVLIAPSALKHENLPLLVLSGLSTLALPLLIIGALRSIKAPTALYFICQVLFLAFCIPFLSLHSGYFGLNLFPPYIFWRLIINPNGSESFPLIVALIECLIILTPLVWAAWKQRPERRALRAAAAALPRR